MNPGNGIETITITFINIPDPFDFLLMNPGNGIETVGFCFVDPHLYIISY